MTPGVHVLTGNVTIQAMRCVAPDESSEFRDVLGWRYRRSGRLEGAAAVTDVEAARRGQLLGQAIRLDPPTFSYFQSGALPLVGPASAIVRDSSVARTILASFDITEVVVVSSPKGEVGRVGLRHYAGVEFPPLALECSFRPTNGRQWVRAFQLATDRTGSLYELGPGAVTDHRIHERGSGRRDGWNLTYVWQDARLFLGADSADIRLETTSDAATAAFQKSPDLALGVLVDFRQSWRVPIRRGRVEESYFSPDLIPLSPPK